MKKWISALCITLGAAGMSLPAQARPGERVDFYATILQINGNNLRVQQSDSGTVWNVNYPNTQRGRNRNRNWNYFRPGQQLRITGMQTGWDRIRADAQLQNAGYYPQPGQAGPVMTSGLNVYTPTANIGVPGNFNVQGQTSPYSTVQVRVQAQNSLLPGVLQLPGQTWTYSAQADASGHFDVPVQAHQVGLNQPLALTITAAPPGGAMSQPVYVNVFRRS